jgi:excisionase family DNA binding protein
LKEQPSDNPGRCSIKDGERLLTVEEVAQLISFSEKSIYQLVHRKVIPYTKISGALRFRSSDIAAWIEENTFKPQSKEKKKEKDTGMDRPRPRQGSRSLSEMDRIVEQTRRKYLES